MKTTIQNTGHPYRIPCKAKGIPEPFAARFVRRLGIRPNLTGYRYLITAIELGVRCPALAKSLTHGLYPAVAEYYRVKPSNVERNIRQAIDSAYDNDPKRLHAVFYYKVGKPYASEIIALAIDTIHMRSHAFAAQINSLAPHPNSAR